MHLIGAGLPRTGTLTQKLALELLGLGPCYHWVDVIANLDRVAQWERALDGEAPWAEIFDGCHSTVDWPGGFFYAELAEAYPQAKVLLSVREAERWERYLRLIDRMFWIDRGTFAGSYSDPQSLIAAMHRHEDAVKAAVPAERLLVWDVTEGWGPLCEFLEVPVPDQPLPHANDRDAFMYRVTAGALGTLQTWHEARPAPA